MSRFTAAFVLWVNRRCIARGSGVGQEFLSLLSLESSSGALPLPIQRVGQGRVRFRITWICVDCCLELHKSLSDLTPLQ